MARMLTRGRKGTVVMVALLAMITTLLVALPGAAVAGETECNDDYVSMDMLGWHVYPSGGDDTENIQCALDEAAGSPGAKVFLAEGDFYTNWIFVEDFYGKIRGDGYDETTVRPLPGGLDCVSEFEANGFLVWWAFTSSKVMFQDMAFDIPLACAEPYLEEIDPDGFGFSLQDFNIMVVVATRSPNADGECAVMDEGALRVKHVKATAPFPDFEAPVFNPMGAFAAFNASGTPVNGCDFNDRQVGKVRVTHSYIDGFGSPLVAENWYDSPIVFKHNTVPATDAGVIGANLQGSVFRVLNNDMATTTFTTVLADNCAGNGNNFADCAAATMKVRVKDNDVHADGSFTGIFVTDGFPDDLFPQVMNARVNDNDIEQSESLTGIFLDRLEDARIRRNDHDGLGLHGIIADAPTANGRIIGNDMRDLISVEDAHIILGPETFGNLVKNNPGATVVDLGANIVLDAIGAVANQLGFEWAQQADRNYRYWSAVR